MIWAPCLLCVTVAFRVAHAGPIRKTSKMEDGGAAQEEVNVLMFGTIQFSESLNYVYETTEAKIAKISQALGSHEGALRQLEEQTEQAAETEKQIKGAIRSVQAQMAEQQTQTRTTKDWLAHMEQEETELKTRLRRLEIHLKNALPASIRELKERATENLYILKCLKHFTEFQHQNIESHDEEISTLQRATDAMENPF